MNGIYLYFVNKHQKLSSWALFGLLNVSILLRVWNFRSLNGDNRHNYSENSRIKIWDTSLMFLYISMGESNTVVNAYNCIGTYNSIALTHRYNVYPYT